MESRTLLPNIPILMNRIMVKARITKKIKHSNHKSSQRSLQFHIIKSILQFNCASNSIMKANNKTNTAANFPNVNEYYVVFFTIIIIRF